MATPVPDSWSGGLITAIAWRNLWRNRRRTWLSAGGIAFAVVLLLCSRSLQLGGYKGMTESALGLLHGHVQIQHVDYLEEQKLEYLVPAATKLTARLSDHPLVNVAAPRATAFVLLSVGEKSFGAQVLGVDPHAEQQLSSLPSMLSTGRYLDSGKEAFIGSALALNLGVTVGDELLILGSGREGGMAALALTVVGIFDTGLTELDRALVEVPLDVFREGFFLGDEAHQIALKLTDIEATDRLFADIEPWLGEHVVARRWQELMPEVDQSIMLDRLSAKLFYFILSLVVLFSVVNTFIMMVFERTHEFGMLLAIGMRPWRIIAMLQLEAFWLSLLGGLLGAAVASPLLAWLILEGIPLGELGSSMPNLLLPSHMRGAFQLREFTLVPLLFIVSCQLAAFLPGLRLRRMQPVEALRVD